MNQPLSNVPSSRLHGRRMFRRLLPYAVLVSIVSGVLVWGGHEAGFYGFELAVVLLVLVNILLLLVGIRQVIQLLEAIESDRIKAGELLHQAEHRYRTTLDEMQEGCQIIGYDYRYLYVNEVVAKQGRRSREELMGRTMMEMYPGIEGAEFFPWLKRCLEERVPHQMENEFAFPDGSKGWFNLNIEPVSEGAFILSVDITNEKRMAEELAQHRERLEELVQKRTAQLEGVNKELEAFSYSVSHDLRAPLRHIGGFVELLQKRAGEALDQQSHRYLKVISDSAKEMGVLVDELLIFSRMGRVEMKADNIDMQKLVAEVLKDCQRETGERAIEWIVGVLPDVQGDPSMLRLVMANLIGNAVKYTGKRERARIEIGCTTGEGETVFFVRDNGAGFDMRYVGKLFGVFQRLHRAEEFEGTGVGLANVHRIVLRHGGRTWAEGEDGKGAVFYFSLPGK